MDVLITFPDTDSVLQAEQILIRHRIPFETVPHSQYNRSRCGLAILTSDQYAKKLTPMLKNAQIQFEFIQVKSVQPLQKS